MMASATFAVFLGRSAQSGLVKTGRSKLTEGKEAVQEKVLRRFK
jgi:hypothetical protein